MKTIEYAVSKIKSADKDDGIIYLKSNYTLDKNLSACGKKLIISGDAGCTLDFSIGTASLNNDTEFTGDLTVKFPRYVIANGYSFKIDETVSVENADNAIQVYGGSSGGNVNNTDVTILSGTYGSIYGGGINGGNVKGNTKVTVAGNVVVNNIYGGGNKGVVDGNTQVYCYGTVNSDLDITNHSNTRVIYGGSNNGTVNGNSYVNFSGSAKADLVYGGGNGSSSVVNGKCTVEFVSGTAMGLYGGSNGGVCKNTYVVMNGGYVEQIFGGSNSASITGNTDVRVLGGTVRRRVYGGCYNECDAGLFSDTWKSSYFVTGNTNVVFSCNADFPRDHKNNDNALCAISRYIENKSAENATLILSDYKDTYKNKIGSSYFKFTNGAYDCVFYVDSGIEAYSNGSVIYLKALKAGTICIKSGDSTENVEVSASEIITRNLSNFISKETTVTLS